MNRAPDSLKSALHRREETEIAALGIAIIVFVLASFCVSLVGLGLWAAMRLTISLAN